LRWDEALYNGDWETYPSRVVDEDDGGGGVRLRVEDASQRVEELVPRRNDHTVLHTLGQHMADDTRPTDKGRRAAGGGGGGGGGGRDCGREGTSAERASFRANNRAHVEAVAEEQPGQGQSLRGPSGSGTSSGGSSSGGGGGGGSTGGGGAAGEEDCDGAACGGKEVARGGGGGALAGPRKGLEQEAQVATVPT